MPTYELDDLLYHEGIPGHHMQFSTILADKSIPELRKVNEWWQDTAFVEGWALYAERLAKDMGFYQDPYADFGRLVRRALAGLPARRRYGHPFRPLVAGTSHPVPR